MLLLLSNNRIKERKVSRGYRSITGDPLVLPGDPDRFWSEYDPQLLTREQKLQGASSLLNHKPQSQTETCSLLC